MSNSRYQYVNNVVMVLYSFSGAEKTIVPSGHGNSNEVPNSFTAVKISVIASVSSKARSTSSREALEQGPF